MKRSDRNPQKEVTSFKIYNSEWPTRALGFRVVQIKIDNISSPGTLKKE